MRFAQDSRAVQNLTVLAAVIAPAIAIAGLETLWLIRIKSKQKPEQKQVPLEMG